jgi:hypothetical protein
MDEFLFLDCKCSAPASESGGGPPQSKTWRNSLGPVTRDSVLDCARPLALFFARLVSTIFAQANQDVTVEFIRHSSFVI